MLVEGTIVIMDLDRFGDMVREKGWSEYSPNPVTGTLTRLVEEFVSKWSALVLYGLDPKRGTEEVVLEVPGVSPEELEDDLRRILEEVKRLGACISIVAVKAHVGLPASGRREAYMGTPGRRLAAKLLRKAKRRGGCKLIVQ